MFRSGKSLKSRLNFFSAFFDFRGFLSFLCATRKNFLIPHIAECTIEMKTRWVKDYTTSIVSDPVFPIV